MPLTTFIYNIIFFCLLSSIIILPGYWGRLRLETSSRRCVSRTGTVGTLQRSSGHRLAADCAGTGRYSVRHCRTAASRKHVRGPWRDGVHLHRVLRFVVCCGGLLVGLLLQTVLSYRAGRGQLSVAEGFPIIALKVFLLEPTFRIFPTISA